MNLQNMDKNNLFKYGLLFSVLILLTGKAVGSSFSSSLFAVNDSDSPSDAYDLYIDYTEFERTKEERQDIRFFKEGRFLTIGGTFGGKFFTGSMSQQLKPYLNYGFQIGMFTNLQFCLQLHGLWSYHPFTFKFDNNQRTLDGFFEFLGGGADLKYYFDRNQLLRPIALLNPYLLVGFSVIRKNIISGPADIDSIGYGFRTGGGLEINLSKTFFVGIHGDFNYIHFPDERTEWQLPTTQSNSRPVPVGIYTFGDIINALFILGMNF